MAELSRIEGALWLATRGLPVFPFEWNEKGEPVPCSNSFWESATTDPNKLKRWFEDKPYLVAVATGGNLFALDVDIKEGKKGDESLLALELQHGELPPTLTLRSRSGGWHYILSTPVPVANSVCKIAPGLDTRGHHGFIISLGTPAYAVEHDRPIAEAPAWLLNLCDAPRPKSDITPVVELDLPESIKRAESYLANAEPAIQGAGGDQHTVNVAMHLGDLGISESTTLDLILGPWNDRCQPPWGGDEMGKKVANAYLYRNLPVGIAHPDADFEYVDPPPAPPRTGLYFELARDVHPDIDSVPLVDNYLDQHAFSVLYGESNTGKTFIAIDLAFHVSLGRPWAIDNPTHKQGVVYVAAEGGKGVRKRIAALRAHFQQADFPVALVPCSVNLLGRNANTKALGALVTEAATALGCAVGLIVIDTLARAMPGGNENASEDMGAFVQSIDYLRAETGAHVLVVHHSGKDTAKGARGHSSLRAATDTELEITENCLQVRKQRDGEYMAARGFALHTVDLGVDRRGKPVTSCVVSWAVPGDDFQEMNLTPDERHCLDALEAALGEVAGIGVQAVNLAAIESGYDILGLPLPNPRTLRRWLLALQAKGVVKREGTSSKTLWSTK